MFRWPIRKRGSVLPEAEAEEDEVGVEGDADAVVWGPFLSKDYVTKISDEKIFLNRVEKVERCGKAAYTGHGHTLPLPAPARPCPHAGRYTYGEFHTCVE